MTYDQWFRSQQGIAYEGSYLFAEAAWEHQQKRIDALEKQLEKNNPLLDLAADAIDRLSNERDELLAALEQFATWGRMQHKAQSKGCHATFDMMALKDEIDLAEAAIASVKGQA